MVYLSRGGGYACSGYCARQRDVSDGYASERTGGGGRVLGCTCGGAGPCRGTCRMIVPD